MIIADTNVVSEFMKDVPDPTVLTWAEGIDSASLGITVVTVEEIERGLGQLPQGRRRQDLERRWAELLAGFADAALVVYDLPAARHTARVLLTARAMGRPMSLADAQIAGMCLAGGHTLANQDICGFAGADDLTLHNPFE